MELNILYRETNFKFRHNLLPEVQIEYVVFPAVRRAGESQARRCIVKRRRHIRAIVVPIGPPVGGAGREFIVVLIGVEQPDAGETTRRDAIVKIVAGQRGNVVDSADPVAAIVDIIVAVQGLNDARGFFALFVVRRSYCCRRYGDGEKEGGGDWQEVHGGDGRGVRREEAGTRLKNDQRRALIFLSVLGGFAPDVGGHEVINPRTFLWGGGGGGEFDENREIMWIKAGWQIRVGRDAETRKRKD